MRSIFTSLSIVFFLAVAAAVVGCSESASPSTNSNDGNSQLVPVVATVNEYCPIMGGKVSQAGGTVDWNGNKIGFCCDGCDDKFMALSEEEKAEKLAEALAKTKAKADADADQDGR
jgi:hypothetical protein